MKHGDFIPEALLGFGLSVVLIWLAIRPAKVPKDAPPGFNPVPSQLTAHLTITLSLLVVTIVFVFQVLPILEWELTR